MPDIVATAIRRWRGKNSETKKAKNEMKVKRLSKNHVPGSGPMLAHADGDELEFEEPLKTAAQAVEPEKEVTGSSWRGFKPYDRPILPARKSQRRANPRHQPHC